MLYILTVLGIVNLIGLGVIFLRQKQKTADDSIDVEKLLRDSQTETGQLIKTEMTTGRKEAAEAEKRLREEVTGLFKNFSDSLEKRATDSSNAQTKSLDAFSAKLSEVVEKNEVKMERIKEAVEKKLESIQKDNGEKLESMRQTVDEKLHATLEKRFNESFKQVSERLEQVHKGLGEMQTIATGVGDLKRVLTNVKTRGTWGEAQLSNLLEEVLTPEQYEKNVKTKKGSKDNVEFAIKFPGDGGDVKHIWLPIDAKFPLEDYQKLVDAQDKGDIATAQEMGKALELRIKGEAKDIRDKYIDPPHTTDFGILYLPFESLYAEVLRRPGLFEQIRQEYRVVITGPTTIQAILNSLQVGFRTLSIQKRSSEVWALLGGIKSEFGKFGLLLEKTHKKLVEATGVIEDAAAKSRNIEGKLNRVQGLNDGQKDTKEVEPIATETLAIE